MGIMSEIKDGIEITNQCFVRPALVTTFRFKRYIILPFYFSKRCGTMRCYSEPGMGIKVGIRDAIEITIRSFVGEMDGIKYCNSNRDDIKKFKEI